MTDHELAARARREHAGHGPAPLSPSRLAFSAFHAVMLTHRQLMVRKLGEHGIHAGQAMCLRELGHHDGITQGELAGLLNVARPTVTVMLQKMEKAGLVERRPDARDQRYTRIHLTDAGWAIHGRMHVVVGELVDATIGRMTEDDQFELARLLGRLKDTMDGALGESPAA